MRILASNPDTIGDMVLRQPLYASLLAAGHELMVTVRPMLAPLMGQVAPGARIVPIDVEPYKNGLEPDSEELDAVAGAARAFEPDVLLIAPHQWTVLEERLRAELPGVRCVAMTGKLYGDPNYGVTGESALDPTELVEAGEEMPELRKNEKLASVVLGAAMQLPEPHLAPTESQRRMAETELVKLGLDAGGYWVACVGDSRYTALRNWQVERWGEALAAWSAKRGRRFLCIGTESERESIAGVREAMRARGESAAEWIGADHASVEALVGLIAASAGYVGRDTGPMHLAAALGKPVLAVFGGGTWPRFLPAVDPSVSITVGVPCIGCGWRCHLSDSYCIKDVPVAAVLAAADELEEGRVARREARIIPPGASLLTLIGREGAVAARERLARATESERNEREMKQSSESLAAVVERAMTELARASERAARAETALGHAQGELTYARGVAEASAKRVSELEAASSRHVAELAAERAKAEEATRAGAALRASAEERGAAADRACAELAAAREVWASRERGSAESERRREAAERELSKVRFEGAQREADLREKLSRAHSEVTRLEGVAADLRLKLARYESDQATLASLSRQNEAQLALLRSQLNDLMSSRWRKLGQRLGVAMTMPWEQESRNGRA